MSTFQSFFAQVESTSLFLDTVFALIITLTPYSAASVNSKMCLVCETPVI